MDQFSPENGKQEQFLYRFEYPPNQNEYYSDRNRNNRQVHQSDNQEVDDDDNIDIQTLLLKAINQQFSQQSAKVVDEQQNSKHNESRVIQTNTNNTDPNTSQGSIQQKQYIGDGNKLQNDIQEFQTQEPQRLQGYKTRQQGGDQSKEQYPKVQNDNNRMNNQQDNHRFNKNDYGNYGYKQNRDNQQQFDRNQKYQYNQDRGNYNGQRSNNDRFNNYRDTYNNDRNYNNNRDSYNNDRNYNNYQNQQSRGYQNRNSNQYSNRQSNQGNWNRNSRNDDVQFDRNPMNYDEQPNRRDEVQLDRKPKNYEEQTGSQQKGKRVNEIDRLVAQYNEEISEDHIIDTYTTTNKQYPIDKYKSAIQPITDEMLEFKHQSDDFVYSSKYKEQSVQQYTFQTQFLRLPKYDVIHLIQNKFKPLQNINKPYQFNDQGCFVLIRPNSGLNNINKALKYGIWTSLEVKNIKLSELYKSFPVVYLIFLPHNKNDQETNIIGIAKLTSDFNYSKHFLFWDRDAYYFGTFQISWIYVKDVNCSQIPQFTYFSNERKHQCNIQQLKDGALLAREDASNIFKAFEKAPNFPSIFRYFQALDIQEDKLRSHRQNNEKFKENFVMEADKFELRYKQQVEMEF